MSKIIFKRSPLGQLDDCPYFDIEYRCLSCGRINTFERKIVCSCYLKSKFKALRVFTCGHSFDSLGEASRFSKLKFLEMKNIIQNLERQVRYPFVINEVKICEYVSDYEYDFKQQHYVEDFKGKLTAIFKLKHNLLRALHPTMNFVLSGRALKKTKARRKTK